MWRCRPLKQYIGVDRSSKQLYLYTYICSTLQEAWTAENCCDGISGIHGVSDRILASILQWVQEHRHVIDEPLSFQKVHLGFFLYLIQAVSTAHVGPYRRCRPQQLKGFISVIVRHYRSAELPRLQRKKWLERPTRSYSKNS